MVWISLVVLMGIAFSYQAESCHTGLLDFSSFLAKKWASSSVTFIISGLEINDSVLVLGLDRAKGSVKFPTAVIDELSLGQLDEVPWRDNNQMFVLVCGRDSLQCDQGRISQFQRNLRNRGKLLVPVGRFSLEGFNLRLDSEVFAYECADDEIVLSEWYKVKNGPLITEAMGVWSLKKRSFSLSSSWSMWERRKNLHGTVMTTANLDYDPIFLGGDDKVSVGGFFGDIILMIAEHLNFTVKSEIPSDGTWAQKSDNGSWRGLVGDLVRKKMDICLSGLTVTRERKEVIDFTLEITRALVTVAFKSTNKVKINYSVYFDAFTDVSWLSIASVIVTLGIFFTVVIHSGGDRGKQFLEVLDYITVVAIVMLQRDHYVDIESVSAKVVFFTACLFGVFIFAAYSAVLTSTMTSLPVEPDVRNFQQILDEGYSLAVWKDSLVHDFFKNAPEGSTHDEINKNLLEDRADATYESISEAVEFLDRGAEFASYEEDLMFRDIPGVTTLRDFEDATFVPLAFGLPKNSEFTKFLDYHLLKVMRSGLYRWLTIKWGFDKDLVNSESPTTLSLGYDNLMFLMLILAFGVIGSVIVSLLEYDPLDEDFPFVIDDRTGVVTVKETLDFENVALYTVPVVVTDRQYTTVQNLIISLTDVNDEIPHLAEESLQLQEITNEEADGQPTSISYVAVDNDGTSPNNDVLFTLTDDNSGGLFSLTEDGVLFVTQPLGEIEEIFDLVITLTDQGIDVQNSNSSTVQVSVLDTNNNPPEFLYPLQPVYIKRNESAGPLTDFFGVTVKLTASDADKNPDFKKIRYFLDDDNTEQVMDYFSVDSTTGRVSLKLPLDGFNITDEAAGNNEIPVNFYALDNPDATLSSEKNLSPITVSFLATSNFQPYFRPEDVLTSPIRFQENDETASSSLPSAVDQNIEEGTALEGEEICYVIIDELTKGVFAVEAAADPSLPPTLKVLQALDREANDTFDLNVVATNQCQGDELNSYDGINTDSILEVIVEVLDVNDNDPEFDVDEIFGAISVDDTEPFTLDVTASDADLQPSFHFSIVSEILESNNSQSLESIPEPPFEVVDQAFGGTIKATFTPTVDMRGYFTFDLMVEDSEVEPIRSSVVPVKIVFIADENVVILTFNNPSSEVDAARDDIVDIFESNFVGWQFKIEETLAKDTTEVGFEQTEMSCYFLDQQEYDPITNSMVYLRYTEVYSSLTADLDSVGLSLSSENGFDTGNGEDPSTTDVNLLAIGFIIVASVIGIMLGFLAVTYFIRVGNLERRVRALNATSFGSRDSGLNNAGGRPGVTEDFVPGTNVHAAQGANPIWKVDDDQDRPPGISGAGMGVNPLYTDDRQGFDTYSMSSGDEVLIGVEDRDEFADHKQTREPEDITDNLSFESLDVGRLLSANQRLDPAQDQVMSIGNPLYVSDEDV